MRNGSMACRSTVAALRSAAGDLSRWRQLAGGPPPRRELGVSRSLVARAGGCGRIAERAPVKPLEAVASKQSGAISSLAAQLRALGWSRSGRNSHHRS
jgi:hypothetical protein